MGGAYKIILRVFWNKCKAVYVFQQLNEQSFIYFSSVFFKYLYSSLDNFVQYTSLCKWKINWAQNIRTSCFVCFCSDGNYFWGLQACYCVLFFLSASKAKLALLVLIASVSVFVCLSILGVYSKYGWAENQITFI